VKEIGERRVLGFGLGTKGKERKVRECGNEVFVVEISTLYMGKEWRERRGDEFSLVKEKEKESV